MAWAKIRTGLNILSSKRIDVETPRWMNWVWIGGVAITLKPFGKFYKNGYKTKCIVVHEDYHWDDIPDLKSKSSALGIIMWYGSYVVELLGRWALNGFRPIRSSDHSKESGAYIAQYACEEN